MGDLWKILRRFVPPYKKYLILSILFNFLAAFLTIFSFAVIMPILRMLFRVDTGTYEYMEIGRHNFTDALLNNFYYYTQEAIALWGPSTTLALLAATLVVMTALKTGTTFLSSYFIVPMRSGIVRDIRNVLYDKIVSLPISFFTTERKGDVMARMSGDVAEIENSIMASLDMLFKNPVLIIVYLATMIIISWKLTLFVLILLPVAGFAMGRIGKRLKRTSFEGQQQWGVIMSYIEETLGGLRIIKAFTAERKVEERFHAGTQRFFVLSNRVARRQALAHPMSEFLGTLTIAVVLWFGGSLILSGGSTLDASDFIYYMVVFYSIINPAKDLSKAMYSIQKGLASMERVDRILGAENPITDPAQPREITSFKGEVRYHDVTFSYDKETPVARNVSFTIAPGRPWRWWARAAAASRRWPTCFRVSMMWTAAA